MSTNPQQLKNIFEAAILAAGEPLSLDKLLALFPEEERPDRDEVRAILEDIKQDYEGRGIELVEVSSGYRLQVKQEFAPWISRLWEERPPRYSRALLETLALVAYRQPLTRGEIEEIRGVSVSTNIFKTLMERDWVRVMGHREVPGKPALYGTTRQFLDDFNLKTLSQLPPLSELKNLDSMAAGVDLAALLEAGQEQTSPEAAATADAETAGDEVHAEQVEAQDASAPAHVLH